MFWYKTEYSDYQVLYNIDDSNQIVDLSCRNPKQIDQVRAIDVSRIVAYRGSLTTQQYAAIAKALQQIVEAVL